MSHYSLAVQGSYKTITLALFRDTTLIDTIQESSSRASSSLIPLIDQLLNRNNVVVENLAFIACEQGPGAFTSLRVTLSTINGIGYASGVPLVGVDGLKALAHSGKEAEYSVSLLNAFNNEVYYGIYQKIGAVLEPREAGYCAIEKFIDIWKTKYHEAASLAQGNGALLFKDALQQALPSVHIPIDVLETAPIEAVHALGRQKFLNKEYGHKLQPLYLKEQTYAIKQ